MKKVDLHTHTNLSDGLYTPEEIVKEAIKKDCNMIAITDHDTINDYSNLERKYKITILSGIEFNTSVTNLHLLGYNIKNISLVNKEMLSLRLLNEMVCYEVITLMQRDGFDISFEQINEYMEQINLEHDIIDKRKIVKYLLHKGYVQSTIEAYKKYIGKNQKYYVPNYKISPQKVIDMIIENGGNPVLAHPGTLKISITELYNYVKQLTNYGLSGIEVINKKMLSDNIIYNKLADSYNLIKTVGSDFHEPGKDVIGITIIDELYEDINKRLIKKK